MILPDSTSILDGLYHFLTSVVVISIDGFNDPLGIITICVLEVYFYHLLSEHK